MKRTKVDWESSEATIEYTSDVEAYAQLPYHFDVYHDAEDGWVVTLPEFPGMIAVGDTADETILLAEDAKRAWIAVTLRANLPVPLPRTIEKPAKRSGTFTVRMTATLHEMAAAEAKRNDLSLNEMVVQLMTFAVVQGFDSVIRHAVTNRLLQTTNASKYLSNPDFVTGQSILGSVADEYILTMAPTVSWDSLKEYDFGKDELAERRRHASERGDHDDEDKVSPQYTRIEKRM